MKREYIRFKIVKIFLVCLFFLMSSIGFNYFAISSIQAATSLEIIQDKDNESKPLKPFLYIGERMDWDVKLNGETSGGTNSNGFIWSSSNPSIVSVDSDDYDRGYLIAHAKGSAIISVKYQDGTTASVVLQIKQPATSISLTSSAIVYVGVPTKLNAIINPSNTDDKNDGVVWESLDPSIASIDATTGNIIAKQNGQVVIKATFTNKDRFTEIVSPVVETLTATSTITIRTKVTGVKLDKKSLAIKKGKTGNIEAKVLPATASNKNVKWTSSNSKVFSVSNGKITSKKQGYGYIKVTTDDGKKVVYAPVSVYESINKTTAYTKKDLSIKNGASKTSKYVSVLKKLKKDTKVTIYGKSGDFFYVKYGEIYGFILKKDLIYMSISAPQVTLNKDTKKYPTIKVTIHNSTAVPKWTNTNKVVSFMLKKNSKTTKKYDNGTSKTTRTYYVKPKKEGRVNTKVKVKKASSLYYVSSYTRIKDSEAFVKVDTTKMYKGASTALPIRKELKKNNKVIILAKCGKNWFYVKHGNSKGFVKASAVVYIKISDSFSMYRYNNKNFSAYLINSAADDKIKWYTSNSKTAKIKEQISLSNKKQVTIWAEKNGSVTLTTSYEYTKGKTIKAKVKLTIKKVKLEIYSVKNTKVGQTLQVKARIKNVINPKPIIKFSTANTSLFNETSQKSNIGKYKIQSVGSGTITVKYRSLKASKKITTKPLLIYGTVTRPGLTDTNKKTEDMKYNDKTSKQIIDLPYITKADYVNEKGFSKLHIGYWKALCRNTTTGTLQDNGLKMIDNFIEGKASTYSNSNLTEAAKNHSNTQKYLDKVNESFKTVIKQKKGNVALLKYVHTTKNRKEKYSLIKQMSDRDVYTPAFNNTSDYITGLKFAINQVHATTIEVVSYKYNSKTKKYTVKFKHTFYDHFGLDTPDIEKFGWLPGFKSWYILQHDKKLKGKYKPFITKMEFYETINGNV